MLALGHHQHCQQQLQQQQQQQEQQQQQQQKCCCCPQPQPQPQPQRSNQLDYKPNSKEQQEQQHHPDDDKIIPPDAKSINTKHAAASEKVALPVPNQSERKQATYWLGSNTELPIRAQDSVLAVTNRFC